MDIYDVKRFINNKNVRDIDIIALFKKVNNGSISDNRAVNRNN